MARRRFNWKFAGAVSAVLAVVASIPAGVYLYHRFKPKDPVALLRAGDQFRQAGDLGAAMWAYGQAKRIRPTDPMVHLKIGDLYYAMRDQGAGNVRLAIDEWTRAEELKPDLTPAWQGLLEANFQGALASAQRADKMHGEDQQYALPLQFSVARNAAEHLLYLDPGNLKARSAMPVLTINLWLLNLPIPETAKERSKPAEDQPTDAKKLDQAVAELTGLMRDHPDDADLPFWIARAKIGQAMRLASQSAPEPAPLDGAPRAPSSGTGAAPGADDQATRIATRQTEIHDLLNEAAIVFDDPIARVPNDAELYFKKYQILSQLMRADPSPDDVEQYDRQRRDALDHAQRLVSPTAGNDYTSYKATWAEYLAKNDPAQAEAVYKALLEHLSHPPKATTGPQPSEADRILDEVQVRVQYARMLGGDATRRADALDVLRPVPTGAPQSLPTAVQQQVAVRLALVRLLRAQVLTDMVEASSNPTTRDALTKQASAEIDAAAANTIINNEYEVPKARGRLQMVNGKFRDAIQSLTAAADRLAASSGGVDYTLLDWEATAYDQTGQTSEAIRLLETAVGSSGGANDAKAHRLLAKLYLEEQHYDLGRQQVSWLSERFPEDVQTIQLELMALGRNPDPKAVAPLYDRLPERTEGEQLGKAAWAERTANVPEQERLYRLVLKAHPAETGVAVHLAAILAADGKLAEANALLDDATVRNPDKRDSIDAQRAAINGASVAAIEEQDRKAIAAMKDPMGREMTWFQYYQRRGDLPNATAHLEAALAIQPDNAQALGALFNCHLQAKRIDKAQAMIPHLTDKDVDQAHGLLFRFRLAMAQGDWGLAATLGHQLTHDFPQFASSWECLGEAQQAAGQLEPACQQFVAALAHQGNNPEAMTRLVDCSIRLGRLDDARRYLSDARSRFPDDPIYRQQAVRVELAYGDPESVLPIVDDDVKQHPDQARPYQVAVQAYAGAAQQRAGRADADGAARYAARERSLLADAVARFPDDWQFAASLADLQSQDKSDAGVAAAAATFAHLEARPTWAGKALPSVMLGRMYLQAGRPDDAEPALRRAVALAPTSPDARTLLADALFARGDQQDALDALAPAKSDPAVEEKYVDLLLAMHRAPQAEAELTARLADKPDDPAAGNLLAHVQAGQGHWGDALATINRTLAANPGDAAAYLVRGLIYANRPGPDLTAAVADLTVYRQDFPQDLRGRLQLARALEATHDVEGATRELEAAVGIAQDSKEARLRLVHAYLATVPPRTMDARRIIAAALATPELAHDPDVQRVAALVWLKLGDNDRAVGAIRDAMVHVADQRSLVDEYFNVLLATGHYDTLLAESAKFIADANASWTVYDFRGRALAASGDATAAYADFSTALDRAAAADNATPALAVANHVTDALGVDRAVDMIGKRSTNSARWQMVLANCYLRGNDHDHALAAAESAMSSPEQFTPADRLLLTNMTADLYMTAVPPRGDKALPLLQVVLNANPDDANALNNSAIVLSDMVTPPRLADALAASTRAFDVVHRAGRVDPYVYDTQGWELILNGKVDDGIDVLHKVADTASFPDVHYHLAEGYLRKQLPEYAKRELDAALATGPTSRPVDGSPDLLRKPLEPAMRAKIADAQRRASDMEHDKLQDRTQAGVGP